MNSPTMLALETDSAWLVILAISLVTLPAALLLRRIIGRPGGLAAGLVLALPLVLPIVVALVYRHAVLPEVSVLRPAAPALLERSGDLLSLVWFSNSDGRMTPYALAGSAGPWLFLVGVSLSSFMLLRRLVGRVGVRRLLRECRPPSADDNLDVEATARQLASTLGLRRCPQLLVLPGSAVAFTTGNKVVIGERLFERLDQLELDGVLAHELVHVRDRDVQLVWAAGFLRDIVGWNPFAHLAYRRLVTDRELEADRRAALLIDAPLAVASGLLKMYELMRSESRRGRHAGLAFVKPGARVSRRVTNLLQLADSPAPPSVAGWRSYFVAGCLVASLGLVVAEHITNDDGSVVAFVWGETTPKDAPLWSPRGEVTATRRGIVAQGPQRRERSQQVARPRQVGRLPLHYAQLAEPVPLSIRQRDIATFVDVLEAVATRRGVPLSLQQSWEANPVISGESGSSFGVFTVRKLP